MIDSGFPTPWRIDVYATNDRRLMFGVVAHNNAQVLPYEEIEETNEGIAILQGKKQHWGQVVDFVNSGSPYAEELQRWQAAHAAIVQQEEKTQQSFLRQIAQLEKELKTERLR